MAAVDRLEVQDVFVPVGRSRRPARPVALLAGVVPARRGWLVAVGRPGRHGPALVGPLVHASLATVLDGGGPFGAVALGVPVGLPDRGAPGGRTCDRMARQLLGRRRGSAVAPAPPRPALGASTVEEARSWGPVSAATWHLMPWIREADERMDASRQLAVSSAHPELSFLRLGDRRPLRYPKHTVDGQGERRRRVERCLCGASAVLDATDGGDEAWRLLDALACLSTAARIAEGGAEHLPPDAELDSAGLRMELVW